MNWRHAVLIGLILGTGACQAPPVDRSVRGAGSDTLGSPRSIDPPAREHRGIAFHSRLIALPAYPQQMQVDLRVDGTETVRGRLARECGVVLHVMAGDRSRWRSDALDAGRCAYLARWGRDEHAGVLRIRTADILGDSIPEGRYDLRVVVRDQGDTLQFDHGSLYLSADTLPPVEGAPGLEVVAAMTSLGDGELGVRMYFRNRGPRAIRLAYAHENCSIRVLLAGSLDPQLRWDESWGCPSIALEPVIFSGQTFVWPSEYEHIIPIGMALRAGLPPGPYRAEALFIHRRFPPGEAVWDTMHFDLATIELAPPRQ